MTSQPADGRNPRETQRSDTGLAPSIQKHLYTYLQPWQTRIISLQPGRLDDVVSCELFPAHLIAQQGLGISELGKIIEYEAVSYSWG